jgi:hypothetical protein
MINPFHQHKYFVNNTCLTYRLIQKLKEAFAPYIPMKNILNPTIVLLALAFLALPARAIPVANYDFTTARRAAVIISPRAPTAAMPVRRLMIGPFPTLNP